jgi:hypothetical protein
MVDLTKFTPTTRDEFEQLARDRKVDFDLLRGQGYTHLGLEFESLRGAFCRSNLLILKRLLRGETLAMTLQLTLTESSGRRRFILAVILSKRG